MTETTQQAPVQNGHRPEAAPAPAPAPRKANKKPLLLAGLAVVLVVGGVVGVRWWQDQQNFMSTNDAQVKGDILSVSPKISGRIGQVHHHEGDRVKPGELLAELDASDIEIQVRQAEANLRAAHIGLSSSKTNVTLQSQTSSAQQAQAAAAVAAASRNAQAARVSRDKAAADFARLEALFREGGVSHQQLDAARAAHDTASAQYQAALAQINNAQAASELARTGETQVVLRQKGVEASQAQIGQAEAALAAARQQLAHTRVLAPAGGTVARVNLHPGEMVQPGQPILTLVSEDDVRVEAFLEETKVQRVREGEAVNVEIDAYPGKVFNGRVTDIGAAAGSEFALIPQNNGTGNFTKVVQRLPIRIGVSDPERLLRPGMSATIHIDVRHVH